MVTSANASYLDTLASELLLDRPTTDRDNVGWRRNDQWIRQSFIVDVDRTDKPTLDDIDVMNRSFSSASLKYTDSSLGGNIVINPPPQFTRYADIPDPGIRSEMRDRDVGVGMEARPNGMGRYYSEAIDDNNQVIHLRFGVAQHNSLLQFFTGFYSSDAGAAARQGRFTDGIIKNFLRNAGKLIGLAIAPLVLIPLAILMVGTAARFFLNWPSSKFYTLKPAMYMYWNAVTSLVNQIGTNQGVITYMDDKQKDSIIGQEHHFTKNEYNMFSAMLGNTFTKNGVIDVFAVANRAKRMQMAYEYDMVERFNNADTSDTQSFFGTVRNIANQQTKVPIPAHPNARSAPSIEAYLTHFLDDAVKFFGVSSDGSDIEKDPRATNQTQDGKTNYGPPEGVDGYLTHLLADTANGSDWVSFRVDYTGATQESFSNSTAESSMAQKINSMSSSARDLRMNFGGLAESIPGLAAIKEGVGAVVSGAASVLHMEGLAAAAGSAFVDIPKHWESSSARLPQSTYTMTLISPYGNPVSQMFNIYFPLALLLGGALPLATGKQSYTSPFLCQLHDRGRAVTRLGIIDSLSISRGTSNLGFNNEGMPMAIKVSFTVLDLSSIVAMPIVPGFSAMPLEGLFDGDNAFSDYLMALSSMKLSDTIYRIPMLKKQLARKAADLATFTSSAHMAAYTASNLGVGMLAGIMRGVGDMRK